MKGHKTPKFLRRNVFERRTPRFYGLAGAKTERIVLYLWDYGHGVHGKITGNPPSLFVSGMDPVIGLLQDGYSIISTHVWC